MKVFKFRNELPDDAAVIKPAMSVGGSSNPADLKLDLHTQNLNAIHTAWAAGRDAETAPAEARKAVAIIKAMYESNRQGGTPITVQ